MQDVYEYLRYTASLIGNSRFGNKIVLKGATALISKLIMSNRMDLYRLTSDLDIHCDKKEIWIDFYTSIEGILNSNDRGYKYRIEKRRSAEKGLETSDSLRFSLADREKIIKFKMDMNIKSNRIITVEYSPLLNINIYDNYTMLSDKIVAVSSDRVYRRIKDLYDIAVLASIADYNYKELAKHIKIKHSGVKLNNKLVPSNYEKIVHAYERYTGISNKPDIRELIAIVSSFLQPFYSKEQLGELVWNSKILRWQRY